MSARERDRLIHKGLVMGFILGLSVDVWVFAWWRYLTYR